MCMLIHVYYHKINVQTCVSVCPLQIMASLGECALQTDHVQLDLMLSISAQQRSTPQSTQLFNAV